MSGELVCSMPEEVRNAETENSVEITIKLTSEDHNVNQQTEGQTETVCSEIRPNHSRLSKDLFRTKEEEEDDDDSGTHYLNSDERPCTHLQRAERPANGKVPDTFQTDHLLYYERFKAYQDYVLGDCKTSEVEAFTAEYLEKIVEPCDWQAIWHTDVFDVLVEVVDVDCKELKAKVELVLPMECETRGCDLTEESMKVLLEATLHKVPLLELSVVYDESRDFDQTALALEHLRLVVDVDCKELKAKVELVLPMECETRGCDLTEESMKVLLEATLHKVPLLELSVVYDESRDFDQTALALEHLSQFIPQFHSDPVLAVSACYEGDVVIVCPGLYSITSSISIVDSIEVEGYGLPDEVVIEKRNKGDTFVESTGANVKLSNLKFIQRDAIEGILCVRQGKLEMENCVMQCETTGVIVRSAAQLGMNMCDLYGSKGAGVEIYPGSVCSLEGNGIHHCKEGILIKDFADELDAMPKITMVNNVIHNNQGYGVILVKPGDAAVEDLLAEPNAADEKEEESEDTGVKSEADIDDDDDDNVPVIVVEEECPAIQHGHSVPPDFTEGNDAIKQELVATSAKKHRLQKSRMKALGAMQADENLLSQEMFISIHGNQFKHNGKGSFGTFLY
ncbi:SHC SH2 domain-binding protein 1-like [Sinocyclocheilus grahami]|uniref:SHC SH2 domain-binding protein 1-like n=1 Tax=Sinocyclocheilus grahami TaxID=75366 RepID=UPI0007AC812C|nr:PREDICTED: SHC SH2 domain-binding protein 1-like [Sinocyclocheilus grahami]